MIFLNEVIVTQELFKRYGEVVALDGLNVKFYRGINGFLGPNGSGKSTTLKITMGLIRPDRGSVRVFDFDPITQGIEVRKILGYFPERDVLNVDIEADKLVIHLGIVSGLSREEAVKRFNDVALLLDLGEEVHRPLISLSHGMRQKIKLAIALIHDPEVLLLDEPTSGLDPIARERMLELIKMLWRELSVSIILSTHILRDVEAVCDRFVVINEGRKVYEGTLPLAGDSKYNELVVRILGTNSELKKFIDMLEKMGHKYILGRMRDEVRIPVTKSKKKLIRDLIKASVETGVVIRYIGDYKGELEELFEKVVS